MAIMRIETDGLDELTSRLDNIGDTLTEGITDALDAAADAFIDDAQARAPVATGYMRDNIQIISSLEDEIVIESSAEYSAFVEFGTRKKGAQPFFEPAIQSAKNALEDRLSDIQI